MKKQLKSSHTFCFTKSPKARYIYINIDIFTLTFLNVRVRSLRESFSSYKKQARGGLMHLHFLSWVLHSHFITLVFGFVIFFFCYSQRLEDVFYLHVCSSDNSCFVSKGVIYHVFIMNVSLKG